MTWRYLKYDIGGGKKLFVKNTLQLGFLTNPAWEPPKGLLKAFSSCFSHFGAF